MSWVEKIENKEFEAGKIAKLPDRPNRGTGYGDAGMTSDQLKAYFDKNTEILKEKINLIIQEADPDNLAEKIEIGPISNWNDIFTLYDLIAALGDGSFTSCFLVEVNGKTYDLKSYLEELESKKLESAQGGQLKCVIYAVDEAGDDSTIGYTDKVTPSVIVRRTSSGDILLPENQTDESAAISKGTVEKMLEKTVDKESFEEEKKRINTYLKSADVTYDTENQVIRFVFTGGDGKQTEKSVDLPLEMAFVSARLDGQSLIFTLQNGQEVSVPLGEVLGGLVTSGSLAQALNGNEEDKAPSVKAVNEGLAGKVGKVSSKSGKNIPWFDPSTGDEGSYTPAFDAVGGTIPLRSGNGEVRVGVPKGDNDAANRKYVDEGLSGKVDKVNKASGIHVYTTESGEQRTRQAVNNPNAYMIALYDSKRALKTETPNDDLDCTNKRYVDSAINEIKDFVYGYIIEHEAYSISFNPTQISSERPLLPFISLNKIGVGIKYSYELKNVIGAIRPEAPAVTGDDQTVEVSTEGFVSSPVVIAVELTDYLYSGTPYKWRVSVVSGNYEVEGGSKLQIADEANMTYVDTWYEGEVPWEFANFNFLLGPGQSVKYNDLVLKFEVQGSAATVEGVPIAAVKIGGDAVYTVPEEIRNIKYAVQDVPGSVYDSVYGLAMSEDIFNYLDFENKTYEVRCAHTAGGLVKVNDSIDVSAYITDDDGFIDISKNSELLFVGEDGNTVGDIAICEITIMIDKR